MPREKDKGKARALHRAHQRMQRFSAMLPLSEGRQGRGENTLIRETFVMHHHHFPPDNAPKACFTHTHH